MAEEFEHILDECIDRLLRGESLEQCLRRYPEQAAELEPLLRVALAAREASSVEPRPEFRERARYQIRSVLHAGEKKRQPRRLPVLGWLPRWATAVVAAFLVFLVAGGGTVAASSNSLPGETLYSVKLAVENVQEALTFSEIGKARLYVKLASRRADEIAQMAERGNLQMVETLARRVDARLKQIEEFAAKIRQRGELGEVQVVELKQKVWSYAVRDMDTLGGVEERAPAHVKPAITWARGKLTDAYGSALQALSNHADEPQSLP